MRHDRYVSFAERSVKQRATRAPFWLANCSSITVQCCQFPVHLCQLAGNNGFASDLLSRAHHEIFLQRLTCQDLLRDVRGPHHVDIGHAHSLGCRGVPIRQPARAEQLVVVLPDRGW